MITFTIIGRPQQRGSKTAVPKRGGGFIVKGGMPVLMDSNKKSKEWMSSVKLAAYQAYGGELLQGPIELRVAFYFKRPQAHYGSGRNVETLKASAPEYHAQSPDLDKLVRCLGDALTGVVWVDDRQVCRTYSERNWTTTAECAVVTIIELERLKVKSRSKQLGLELR